MGEAAEGTPRVRTYHARRGRLSAGHRAALTTLIGEWALDPCGARLDPREVFGRSAPLVLDIGCGTGESARELARLEPGVDVIALDVHTRGIATLLRGIEHDRLRNVRVVLGDAVTFIDQRVSQAQLSGARVFFPDPWPKARHAKRRLIQPAFVALLASRLAPGAFLHCATDDARYADQMRAVFTADPLVELRAAVPSGVRRPVTRYERRARRLGHHIDDIWVTRTL